MSIADPKYLEHLRDLPVSYLFDLLADNEGIDRESIVWVLQEHGLSRGEIESKVQQRRSSTRPRPHKLWAYARWLTLGNSLIVTIFNFIGLHRLWLSDHAFRGALLFLAVGCVLVGFVVGFKLSTHIYQGGKATLYCGFPLPAGYVELQTGEEILKSRQQMILGMAVNAMVGISLTLFPLVLLYIALD